MPAFLNKVKEAISNFHLEQPGVGPGVGGQHGLGANECYTSSSGHRWVENKSEAPAVGAAPRVSMTSANGKAPESAAARDSTST